MSCSSHPAGLDDALCRLPNGCRQGLRSRTRRNVQVALANPSPANPSSLMGGKRLPRSSSLPPGLIAARHFSHSDMA